MFPEYAKPPAPPTPPPIRRIREGIEVLKSTINESMDNITTSCYIPTTFPAPLQLNVGELWYIKFPNATALVEVEVIEVTNQTVVLKQIKEISYLAPKSRYKKSDIEFVEKVGKNND